MTKRGMLDDESARPEGRGMEARLAKVESDIAAMKIDIAVLKATSATKTDIAELKSELERTRTSIILWVVSAIFLAQLLPALLKKFGL